MARTIPRHANRYFESQLHLAKAAEDLGPAPFDRAAFVAKARRGYRRFPLLSAPIRIAAFLILAGCFIKEEFDLSVEQANWRWIDRRLSELGRVVLFSVGCLLFYWVAVALEHGMLSVAVR